MSAAWRSILIVVSATFEHIDNAPAASYRYCKDDPCDGPITVNPQPGRTWLFSANNCTAPKNQARMHATTDGDIVAILSGATIGPDVTDYYPTEVVALNATSPLSNSLLSSRTLIGSKVLVSPLESAEPVY